jgi:hypothetical protein
MEQLGVDDIAVIAAIIAGQPIVPTRSKPKGATKNTSPISIISRRLLQQRMKIRLPTFTNASLRTLKPVMTNNLGAFVGRTIPLVGWVMLTYDFIRIIQKTVFLYNSKVKQEDRVF